MHINSHAGSTLQETATLITTLSAPTSGNDVSSDVSDRDNQLISKLSTLFVLKVVIKANKIVLKKLQLNE
jgi:hypothetical protein